MAPIAQDFADLNKQQINLSLHEKSVEEISISEYIFLRIAQLGIKSVFGVPGDFNLNLLEHIYDVEQLDWIGCCNELNAAYAAQAYSKVTNGLSVLVTTYGVGELSAINGIAGAYCEYNPILHIVGTSATQRKINRGVVENPHHLIGAPNTLNFPDHYIYEKMAESVSATCQSISSVDDACEKVDRAIEITFKKSRPGYLFLPCDLADAKIPVDRLYVPLNLEHESQYPSLAEDVTDEILEAIYKSKNPAVLADCYVKNFRMEKEFNLFVLKVRHNMNLYDTFMGKGLIHEDEKRFLGTFWGEDGSNASTHEFIAESDCVLNIGTCNNETNTGMYKNRLNQTNVIEMNQDYVSIFGKVYPTVNMMDVLPLLSQRIQTAMVPFAKTYTIPPTKNTYKFDAPLTAKNVFDSLQSMIRPNDIVIVETSAFLFASPDLQLRGAKCIAQHCYNSIGFALPATLGACLALRDNDLPGRVITMEGDGSAQMTIQELATIIRHDLSPIFFLMNNEGYTIERVIKGATRSYNDIAPNWKWCEFMKTFGDVAEEKSASAHIETADSLTALLESKAFKCPTKFQFVELILDRLDSNSRITKSLSG